MEQEQYIKNGTMFLKPKKQNPLSPFLEKVVFINSENIRENIKAIYKETDINTIRLTTSGFKLDNLNFLKDYDLSFIKSIDILSDHIENVEGMYSLKHLELINSVNKNIDYSHFPTLKYLFGELSEYSYHSLSKLRSLKSLRFTRFKEKDMSFIKNNTFLEEIMLRGSKLTSLKGIEDLCYLKKIELFHNRSLKSLEGITSNHKSLEVVETLSTPKLFYVNEYLSWVPQLKFIAIDSKKIDSLEFLNLMKNLEIVRISKLIEVEDNNRMPLLNALKRIDHD